MKRRLPKPEIKQPQQPESDIKRYLIAEARKLPLGARRTKIIAFGGNLLCYADAIDRKNFIAYKSEFGKPFKVWYKFVVNDNGNAA